MGDYASVEVLLAESDFPPEDREFMARLRDRVFPPTGSIPFDGQDFDQRDASRRRAHADLHLPGSERDWQFLRSEVIDGRPYYSSCAALPESLTPPFPRRFARLYRLRKKYGIRPTWYALFTPSDWVAGGGSMQIPIGEARRNFTGHFDAIWAVLYADEGDGGLKALADAAPEGSKPRRCLGRVFERFPFHDYLSTLRFLAEDWGGEARIELDFCSVTYCYGEKGQPSIQEEFESTLRVLQALRRLDVAALPGEPFFRSSESADGSGVYPWLVPVEHHEPIRRFREWFAPDVSW